MRSSGTGFTVVAAAALAMISFLAGCSGSGGGAGSHAAAARTTSMLASGSVNADQARSVLMSLADSYVQTVIQSLDELVASTKDPARAEWGRGQRVATLSVSVANATGPNAVVGLLDMVVFATLKRAAVEEHWVPTLLGDEGAGVLDAHRRGETEAWASAGRVFSPSQVKELRGLVDKWRREHPRQHYVGYTRFSDFDVYRSLTPESPEVKLPGSLFGALYMDPLAGLDPMAKELRSYRALTERLAFTITRLPLLASYQLDQGVHGATGTPEVRRFVSATEKFADATGRFADSTHRFTDAVVKYPADLGTERQAAVTQLAEVTTRERQAAIEQAAKAVAAEREAVLKSLSDQEGRVRAVVADVKGLLAQADQVAASVNESTAKTVASTRHAADGALTHALVLGMIFLAALLLGTPAAFLGYRLASRRLLGTAAAPQETGGGADPGTPNGRVDPAKVDGNRIAL
jgi:hypothetical protein